MNTLANFPMVSQRDGDVNADFDCVPACIAACLIFLTGKHYTASQIKDAVYGQTYTGGTAARAYIDYCRTQGVSLTPIDGTGAQLVAALRSMIGSGHPCLITEPDPYMPAGSGWTHVCAAYAFDSASITVMDPWIDQAVSKSDGTWAAQLQDNEIWVLERVSQQIERTNWVSIHQEDQAAATWASTTAGAAQGGNAPAAVGIFPTGHTPAYTTGIAESWQKEYMNGRNWGPPISYEYSHVNGEQVTDWDGSAIVQQNFLGGRCEWNDGQPHWYAWGK